VTNSSHYKMTAHWLTAGVCYWTINNRRTRSRHYNFEKK